MKPLTYVVMGLAIMAALALVQFEFKHASDKRLATLEAAAYQGCVTRREGREQINSHTQAPLREFAHLAGQLRLALSEDMSQSASVRAENRKAARKYFRIAKHVDDLELPRCVKP